MSANELGGHCSCANIMLKDFAIYSFNANTHLSSWMRLKSLPSKWPRHYCSKECAEENENGARVGWDEVNERMKELRVVHRTTKNVENVEINQGAIANYGNYIWSSSARTKNLQWFFRLIQFELLAQLVRFFILDYSRNWNCLWTTRNGICPLIMTILNHCVYRTMEKHACDVLCNPFYKWIC